MIIYINVLYVENINKKSKMLKNSNIREILMNKELWQVAPLTRQLCLVAMAAKVRNCKI